MKPPHKEVGLTYWEEGGLTKENQGTPANSQDQVPDTMKGIMVFPGQSTLQLNAGRCLSPGESGKRAFPSTP